VSDILNIYAKARSFMAEHGNPNQWTKGAPDGKSLQKDILNQASFVVEEGGKVVGTFALYHDDPNYGEIQGSWLNDEPYVVIHRIASIRKGVGTFVLQAVCSQYKNVRIDTIKTISRCKTLLKKMGFVHCGVILLLDKDNSPREAYMKVNISLDCECGGASL
jgi:N-acetylglutamate synthase-like GNAT family acetyltransferase